MRECACVRENFSFACAFKLAGVDMLACGYVRVPACVRECERVCVSAWVLQCVRT